MNFGSTRNFRAAKNILVSKFDVSSMLLQNTNRNINLDGHLRNLLNLLNSCYIKKIAVRL